MQLAWLSSPRWGWEERAGKGSRRGYCTRGGVGRCTVGRSGSDTQTTVQANGDNN